MIRVLLVEDDKIDRQAFERMVRIGNLPYDLTVACSSDEARKHLGERDFDIMLVDYLLGDGTGLELLTEASNTPTILVTGAGSEEIAVQAMRMGAYDYLIKDQEGKFLTVLPVTIDSVLERKKAETALLESEERYRGMAEFADSVIHNVGNVMTSIQTSCEVILNKISRSKLVQVKKTVPLVKQGFANTLEPEKREQVPRYLESAIEVLEKEQNGHVKEVREVLEKLGLVRDIIKSQQSRRRALERIEPFRISELVSDTLKVLKPLMLRYRVHYDVALELDAVVKTDRSTMIHVLINILKNAAEAMEHTEDRRMLTITSEGDDEEMVHLVVRDTGVGISPDNLEQLFSHGFTTKRQGHGFGLHYCAHVLKEMGGGVHVSSAGVNKGSAVRLVLPIYKPDEA